VSCLIFFNSNNKDKRRPGTGCLDLKTYGPSFYPRWVFFMILLSWLIFFFFFIKVAFRKICEEKNYFFAKSFKEYEAGFCYSHQGRIHIEAREVNWLLQTRNSSLEAKMLTIVNCPQIAWWNVPKCAAQQAGDDVV
jgi:hypothetical protein